MSFKESKLSKRVAWQVEKASNVIIVHSVFITEVTRVARLDKIA